MSLLSSKNDTRIFHRYKILSIVIGWWKCKKKNWQKFERLFEDIKLSIHKKNISKVMQTKIAHLVVKRSSFISVNS
jgi:hypothetical protein